MNAEIKKKIIAYNGKTYRVIGVRDNGMTSLISRHRTMTSILKKHPELEGHPVRNE